METKNIKDIIPDDILGEDLFHNNLLIIKRGTRLSKSIITQLRKRSIKQIKIETEISSDVPNYEESTPESQSDEVNSNANNDLVVRSLFFDALTETGFEYRYGKIMNKEEDVLYIIQLFEGLQQYYKGMDILYALKPYDHYSFVHSFDTFVLGTLMAKRIGLVDIESIALGYLLHDIGKINISRDLLRKPGKLTNMEFDNIKQHTIEGEMLLNKLGLKHVAHFARSHHERMDGSGYPDSLSEVEISEELSLLHIVDVYSALTLKRAYKEGVSGQEALELMFKDSHLFDIELLKALSEALGIYPPEATVLLSDNTSAVIKKSQRFLTLPNVKRDNKNQVTTLPINYDITVSELIDVHSIPFHTSFKMFIQQLCDGGKEEVMDGFIKLIDGFKLEDIYTKVLLPAYWELTHMMIENTLTKDENDKCIQLLGALLRDLKQDMLQINQYESNIILVIESNNKNNIIIDFLINLLHVENILPTIIYDNEPLEEIIHIANKNEIKNICIISLLNNGMAYREEEVFANLNVTRKTSDEIRNILLNLSMTKPKNFNLYHRLF